MKRKSRFIIALIAAVLTFGTLRATLGPRHFHHHGNCCQMEGRNND